MPGGKWTKGTSGNPAGRKSGTGQIGKLRAAIAKDVPAIIQSLATSAKAGDIGAARLLLDRVLPALKPIEETVGIALEGGTLAAQGGAVVAAVAAGELAPGQGAALLASLGTLARLIETDELAARVAALEARHGNAQSKA